MSELVKDRPLSEAVLVVNNWCGEQATYAQSDEREASPLGMYNGGAGRCGEEANFVVSALRSVGIPARVCNLDWTVVADGHAIPQVLVDGEWHFIGGCEPDPVLDSGWFTDRLGSLLTAISYSKSDIGIGQPANLWNGTYSVNDIGSFTDTKDITITVLDADGSPAVGIEVDLVLVQPQVYITVLDTIVTDNEGKIHYTLGCGSVSAVAYSDGDWRFGWIEKDQTELTLSFADKPDHDIWNKYPVRYSDAKVKNVGIYTDEDRTALFGDRDYNEVREQNHANDYDASRAAAYPECEENLKNAGRNFKELITFLERDDDPMRKSLVAGLSDKYCREVNADTLEDILDGANSVRDNISDEDFVKGILLPVTEWNYFSPQRLDVQKMFSKEELSGFRADPNSLYRWVDDNIHDECIRTVYGGVPSLYGALRMGYCPEKGRTELLMELARAVGIPVCKDEETGSWTYLSSNGWTAADWANESDASDDVAYGKVQCRFADNEAYRGDYWAIVKFAGAYDVEYQLYGYFEEEDGDEDLDLPVGDYAMILLKMPEEKEGTLYMQRFSVTGGNTVDLRLP